MLMSKNVNNDVSKDSPIRSFHFDLVIKKLIKKIVLLCGGGERPGGGGLNYGVLFCPY